MARLTIPVSEELHVRFKVQCTLARRKMLDVVVELVEQWTSRQEKGKGKTLRRQSAVGFPKSLSYIGLF